MSQLGETDLSGAKPDTKKGGFGRSSQTSIRKDHTCAIAMASLWLSLMTLTPANATALNKDMVRADESRILQKNSALTDPCSPLLRAIPPSVGERRTRPSAGENAAPVAALGFALGLRLVAGPRESLLHRPHDQTSGEGNVTDPSKGGPSPALSIALWRQCRNQMALKDVVK